MAWHDITGQAALVVLDSTAEGLASADADTRRARTGPNALPVTPPTSFWTILLAQLRSVVVALLAGATVVAFLSGERLNAAAILGVLLLNTALGLTMELKARRAMEALGRLSVPRARVVRAGGIFEVDARTLVPGDVIDLEAGSAVPADGRLLTATELRCVEAALTGESLPVEKRAADVLAGDTPLADRLNLVFTSTSVVAGSGRAVVFATGGETELGRIGRLTSSVKPERTPLEQRLDALGGRLVILALGLAAIVAAIGVLRGQALSLALETALALAIAAVPEGLPAVATIALAVGVARMARRGVLVRRLPQVETLGSTTVVCTDKTGTLTAGVMTAVVVVVDGEEIAISGSGYVPEGTFTRDGAMIAASDHPLLLEALRIGALCNRASLRERDGRFEAVGDPTEAALLVAAQKAGLARESLAARWPESGEIPFSSERGWMATFHGAGETTAFLKGAPGRIIDWSHSLSAKDGDAPLDEAGRAALRQRNEDLAARGLRVLAIARASGVGPGVEPEQLTFVALVGIEDPVAEGVAETIASFARAGIRTVMITGDQRTTAETIARQLGILGPGGEVVEGRELSGLDQAALTARIPRVAAFSRVSPEDKMRIVTGLQAAGEIVTMLGDGVNDAPALRKADLGVAMGVRGTDVAKEASAVVLQDDRFATLVVAVEEGRVIFDNIRKFVFFLFSCNLAEILILLGAGLAGLPQPLMPLPILWLNLVTDTFPALSLAVEPRGEGVMDRAPRDPKEALLSAAFVRSIGFYAALIAAVTLGGFVITLRQGSVPQAVTVAFVIVGLAQGFHLGNARSGRSVLRLGPALANRWAVAALLGVVALQVLAVVFAPSRRLLGLVPLPAGSWALAFGLSIIPAVVGQLVRLRATTDDTGS